MNNESESGQNFRIEIRKSDPIFKFVQITTNFNIIVSLSSLLTSIIYLHTVRYLVYSYY